MIICGWVHMEAKETLVLNQTYTRPTEETMEENCQIIKAENTRSNSANR